MKEIEKIEKIKIIYDKETADSIIKALEQTFSLVKSKESNLEPPEILCELIEDLTWNTNN